MRVVVALCCLTACGDEGGFCPEAHVTIQQGVYGVVRSTDDPFGPAAPVPNFRVDINRTDGSLLASPMTSAVGVFEYELVPGRYEACRPVQSPCASFEVTPNARIRADLVMNPDATWTVRAPSDCAQ